MNYLKSVIYKDINAQFTASNVYNNHYKMNLPNSKEILLSCLGVKL